MLQSWGAEVWFLLNEVRDQYGPASHDELTQIFLGDVVEEGVAERFARALELFWDQQYDESAHLIAPRIEKVIRRLAKLMGVPVMREQVGDTPGGVATLGTLLNAIKPKFRNEAQHLFYSSVLVDQLSLNLRNRIAHGLGGVVPPNESALLLQIAIDLSQTSVS